MKHRIESFNNHLDMLGLVGSRLSRLLVQWHLLCDVSYFSDYFDRLNSIQCNSRTAIGRIRCYQWLVVFQSFHVFGLYLAQSHISHRANLLNFNLFHLLKVSDYLHQFAAIYLIAVLQWLELMYFHNFGFSAQLLRSILLDRTHKEPFYQRYLLSELDGGPISIVPWTVVTRRYSFPESMRLTGVALANLFKAVLIYLVIYSVYLQWRFAQCLSPLSSVWGLVEFVVYQMNAILYMASICLVFHTLTLIVVFGALITFFSRSKMLQMERFARKLCLRARHRGGRSSGWAPVKFGTRGHFDHFLWHNTQSIRFLTDLNRVMGLVMLTFILVNVPLNAMLLAMVLFDQLQGHSTFALVLVILFIYFQVGSIFVMHLFAAHNSVLIHRPSRRFLIIGHDRVYGPYLKLPTRLKLQRYIEQFHTNNQYAVKLGKYGQLNFASFSKHMFIYFKLIIFSYKLFK